jgi:predicted O-methyltransferase YrrM
MADLAIIVPTKGRPENILKVISAWDFTNAWDVADLVLAIDEDDPSYAAYVEILDHFNIGVTGGEPCPLRIISHGEWHPMVHKLDETARALSGQYWALGFAGDDHLPRTIGWTQTYLDALRELRTGLVYGDDGFQHENLCTEWAMTSDVVRALGRMVPAPVEHMYSDVSVLETFRAAGAVRYLPQVVIEHMHPIVGKAENDAQYRRVNHRDQFRKDLATYEAWQRADRAADVAAVVALQPDRPMPVAPVARKPRRAVAAVTERAAWGTGRVSRSNNPARSGPTAARGPAVNQTPRSANRITPRYLRDVKALTPPEVGITLADLARSVPQWQAIVELGVHQGYTALMLSYGARQGNGAHVWGFDPWDTDGNVYGPEFDNEGARKWAQYNVRAKGHTKDVHLTQAFSVDAADSWDGRPVGLLYVDGDHTYQGCRSDIEAWARHLAPGAVIAVDDYVIDDPDYDGLRRAVDDLVTSGMLEPFQLFHGRLAVTKLAGETPPDITTPREPALVVPHEAELAGGTSITTADLLGADVTYQDNGTVMVENEGDGSEFERDADDHARGEDDLIDTHLIETDPADRFGTPEWRLLVHEGEVDGLAAGLGIESLSIPNLKGLAKARGIVLGVRKDKRSAILDALREGK